jgi:hypothetical protein
MGLEYVIFLFENMQQLNTSENNTPWPRFASGYVPQKHDANRISILV